MQTHTKQAAQKFLLAHASRQKAQHILEMSRRPIIIGGCGRSGTTLLLSILSCHPHIFGIAEETVALCPDGYGADGLYNPAPDINAPFQMEKIYSYLIEHDIPAHYRRWCEKTPRNVLTIGKIIDYFGEPVRFIHIVRDGRDVVTSRHPHDPARFWTTPDRWVQDVSAGRTFENHPQVLTIRYEDLLYEYEKTVRRVCTFIEEDFDPAFLAYPHSAKINQSGAWFGPAREISTQAIGRWRKPEFVARISELLREPGARALLNYYDYLKE